MLRWARALPRWTRLLPGVLGQPSAATARPCAEGTSVVTSAPSAEVKFAGGGGQIRGARRAGSGGLQAAPVATRTSPDTLGPGPRAGSSGAGHRASRGPSSSGSAEFRINSAPF